MSAYEDTTSVQALAEELAAVTDAERDLYRHAKALSKARRAATTRLVVAWDRQLAEEEGRTACGFDIGFVNADRDQPYGADCLQHVGHEDEHRKGSSIRGRSWDSHWLEHLRGESEEAKRTFVHGHGRKCFRRKDGSWVIKAPGSHGEMRLIVGETCEMKHGETK